jgi:hypothetical protein
MYYNIAIGIQKSIHEMTSDKLQQQKRRGGGNCPGANVLESALSDTKYYQHNFHSLTDLFTVIDKLHI